MPILDFLEAIDDPELDPLRSHEDTVMEHVLVRMFREKAHRGRRGYRSCDGHGQW